MKLGARIFKTGLAIIISMYLASWLGLEQPTFAGIAASFAIQPSVYRTFQKIIEQVQANVIGAVLAVIFVMTFGHEPFVIGFTVMLAIATIMKLKIEATTIPLAVVTIIIIMESPAENFIEFALARFGLIMIGVFAALIVNLVFIPPQYETKLFEKLLKATEDVTQWIMLSLRNDADARTLKRDVTRLDEEIVKIDNLYMLYKEERNYFTRNRFGKARRIVLFRQMVVTTKKGFSVLKNLERRTDERKQLPEEVQREIEEQLDRLTQYHDRIMMRYEGKVSTELADEVISDLNEGKIGLSHSFVELHNESLIESERWMSILPLLSQILEYQEQLEHLDQLVDSFFQFHKNKAKGIEHDTD